MAHLIPLSEGSFTVDKTKTFNPFNPETDDLQQRPQGSLLVEVQPFLLETADDYLLFDAGLGFDLRPGTAQLHHNLSVHGIRPEAITKVLMSHLHKDHASGCIRKDASGKLVLSLPEATYYVSANELDYARQHVGSSYQQDLVDTLTHHPQVTLLGESGTLDGGIRYQHSGGHCPYHQVFWIEDEQGVYFYGGDEAPQLSQLQRRFRAKYDFDGQKGMELRQQYLDAGKREGWTFLFYHDIQTPFFRFEES